MDAEGRKIPFSIAFSFELLKKIDESIRIRYGGKLNRSEYFENLSRWDLEQWGKEQGIENPDGVISLTTALSYICKLKDYIVENSISHKIKNLEEIRRVLEECDILCEQEIRRSRTLSKHDKRKLKLAEAVIAHKLKQKEQEEKLTSSDIKERKEILDVTGTSISTEIVAETDPVENELQQLVKDAYTGYQEKPMPKFDPEILDEGGAPNEFNNDGEDIL